MPPGTQVRLTALGLALFGLLDPECAKPVGVNTGEKGSRGYPLIQFLDLGLVRELPSDTFYDPTTEE